MYDMQPGSPQEAAYKELLRQEAAHPPPEVEPYTPEQMRHMGLLERVVDLLEAHSNPHSDPDVLAGRVWYCQECSENWPCTSARLLATIKEGRE